MSARQPEVASISFDNGQGHRGYQSRDDRDPAVCVQIALRGIKNEPVEEHLLSRHDALRMLHMLASSLYSWELHDKQVSS